MLYRASAAAGLAGRPQETALVSADLMVAAPLPEGTAARQLSRTARPRSLWEQLASAGLGVSALPAVPRRLTRATLLLPVFRAAVGTCPWLKSAELPGRARGCVSLCSPVGPPLLTPGLGQAFGGRWLREERERDASGC